MTVSEKQRLNVACHLLLDTDIVLLDQVQSDIYIYIYIESPFRNMAEAKREREIERKLYVYTKVVKINTSFTENVQNEK